MRARPAGPAESSALHDFARSGPTKEAHRRALNRSGGLLRSVAGRARLRRDPTQRNDRASSPHSQHSQKCPLTCGFGARGGIRTLDLPITSRILRVGLVGSRRIEPAHVGRRVGPDGSRRIQKDRLDDQMDDQGASDRKSDGKASNDAESDGRAASIPAPPWPSCGVPRDTPAAGLAGAVESTPCRSEVLPHDLQRPDSSRAAPHKRTRRAR
jgi:hypothetical protein